MPLRFGTVFGHTRLLTLWTTKLPLDIAELLIDLAQLGLEFACLIVLVVSQAFNLAFDVTHPLLEFAAVLDKLASVGIRQALRLWTVAGHTQPFHLDHFWMLGLDQLRAVSLKDTTLCGPTPHDLDAFEPLLSLFDHAANFYFVAFSQCACRVEKVLLARYEHGYVVVALERLDDDSEIFAFADLTLGPLYKDSTNNRSFGCQQHRAE